MGNRIEFQYFYGLESQQFAFYRIPKLLVKDERFKSISNDAKLLYGLMLDRMALSIKNEWFDEQNRAYIIYTVESISEDLGIGRDKTIRILQELDVKKGIGLIEKIRRGQGKPDIIYVKNFVVTDEKKAGRSGQNDIDGAVGSMWSAAGMVGSTDVSSEVVESDFKKSGKPISGSRKIRPLEVEKTDFKESENPISRSRKNRPLEVGKSDPNYTEYSYTEYNDTNRSQTEMIDTDVKEKGWMDPSINPSIYFNLSIPSAGYSSEGQQLRNDIFATPDPDAASFPDVSPNLALELIEDADVYIQMIKENIDFEGHRRRMSFPSWKLFEELYDLICEVVCIERDFIRIAGEPYPYAFVRKRFLQLRGTHLEYVTELMKQTTTRIRNIKAYMLTALFNAPSTIGHYYQQEANCDLYGSG